MNFVMGTVMQNKSHICDVEIVEIKSDWTAALLRIAINFYSPPKLNCETLNVWRFWNVRPLRQCRVATHFKTLINTSISLTSVFIKSHTFMNVLIKVFLFARVVALSPLRKSEKPIPELCKSVFALIFAGKK